MGAEIKEDTPGKADKLIAHVIESAEVRFDLIAIRVQEKVTEIMASMASIVLMGLVMTFVVLLLSIGAAMYISDYYNSPYIGFVYVAGFYGVIALFLMVTRNRLIKLPIINRLLKKINFHEED